MSCRYTNFDLSNGNLLITLTPEGREFLATAEEDGLNTDSEQFLHDLLDWQFCNGWESIRPEELGALTDAPILSNCAIRDEDSLLTQVHRVYWFPNYQVESAVQMLQVRGTVAFTGVSSENSTADA